MLPKLFEILSLAFEEVKPSRQNRPHSLVEKSEDNSIPSIESSLVFSTRVSDDLDVSEEVTYISLTLPCIMLPGSDQQQYVTVSTVPLQTLVYINAYFNQIFLPVLYAQFPTIPSLYLWMMKNQKIGVFFVYYPLPHLSIQIILFNIHKKSTSEKFSVLIRSVFWNCCKVFAIRTM